MSSTNTGQKRPRKRQQEGVKISTTTKSISKGEFDGDEVMEQELPVRPPSSNLNSDNDSTIEQQEQLIQTLNLLDPLLQFLTRATGQVAIPLPTLKRALPANALSSVLSWESVLHNMKRLIQWGVLHHTMTNCDPSARDNSNNNAYNDDDYNGYNNSSYRKEQQRQQQQQQQQEDRDNNKNNDNFVLSWDDDTCRVGFPPPVPEVITSQESQQQQQSIRKRKRSSSSAAPTETTTTTTGNATNSVGKLHGSTKAAAKRRMAFLKRIMKQQRKQQPMNNTNETVENEQEEDDCPSSPPAVVKKVWGEQQVDLPRPLLPQEIMKMEKQKQQQKDKDMNVKTNSSLPTTTTTTILTAEEREARCAAKNLLGMRYEQENDDDDETIEKLFQSSSSSLPEKAGAALTTATTKSKRKQQQNQKQQHPPISSSVLPSFILKDQLAYAGSHAAQESVYGQLSPSALAIIPPILLKAFGLQGNPTSTFGRKLYTHQVAAIEAALPRQQQQSQQKHVCVCTGTGSGKSLCFWIPILTAAYLYDQTSLVIFPTKALAQDQLSKLQELLLFENKKKKKKKNPQNSNDDSDVEEHDDEDDRLLSQLKQRIRPAALDGDCPHAQRSVLADTCNIILTNPDTLHACILPYWRTVHYKHLLSRLAYVVIDEAHLYQGIFGAHVAMILSRLVRLRLAAAAATMSTTSTTSNVTIIDDEDDMARLNSNDNNRNTSATKNDLTFLAASATLPWPEQHFRLLCPVAHDAPLLVLRGPEDDGSPRSAKHFFVWNPPIMNAAGSICSVHFPMTANSTATADDDTAHHDKRNNERKSRKQSTTKGQSLHNISRSGKNNHPDDVSPEISDRAAQAEELANWQKEEEIMRSQRKSSSRRRYGGPSRTLLFYRRHAADETALLLAKAVSQGVRCIAFCKTRNLVEWVFERALGLLKRDERTADLADRIESYRGGYSMDERRKIEQRLFRNELLGVIGTNALELGVDIGGIDLTLHCGYPSTYASLLQQAGRAGRAKGRLSVPSCSIVVCFNSPAEQHMWRYPKSLLGKGVMASHTIPINNSIVQAHLLCASEEFPLSGELPVTALTCQDVEKHLLNDFALFGGQDVYEEAVDELHRNGSVKEEVVGIPGPMGSTATVYSAHPSMKQSWSRVSIRAIEPVNYSIVDLSHPGQGGQTDGIHDEKAIMDTLPYSRVFYHAHPGAIITHRGRKYKVMSMTRPPTFTPENFGYRRNITLAAYVRPTNERYLTRALSLLFITVVKTFEHVEVPITDYASLSFNEGDVVTDEKPAVLNSRLFSSELPSEAHQEKAYLGTPVAQGGVTNSFANDKPSESDEMPKVACVTAEKVQNSNDRNSVGGTAIIDADSETSIVKETSINEVAHDDPFASTLSAAHIDHTPTRKTVEIAGNVEGQACDNRKKDDPETTALQPVASFVQDEGAATPSPGYTTIAGCGAVNIKRTVHAYKKLSIITRAEISRTELNLPPMEYDSFGIWFDADMDGLSSFLGERYGPGVHALSHAILAVAPVFAQGVVREDLECDHSWYSPTRVVLFDERAGGSGACERIWELFFKPNSILEAAIDLLQQCSWCTSESGYDGGCPACIHCANCMKFNMFLSRSAAVIVGKHLLDRIKQTDLYKRNEKLSGGSSNLEDEEATEETPRRKARERALRHAKEMLGARERQFVVGRPAWPMDGDEVACQQIFADPS